SRWLTLQRLAMRLKAGNLFDHWMVFVDHQHGLQDFLLSHIVILTHHRNLLAGYSLLGTW
ncbi:MAG: hypothetical protein MUE58_07495, partial [Chitinophagaceae bacterium]|nr:hypothetical protein [Chitinophagaceae bacterium]